MDSIPIVDNREYILFNRDFAVVQFSPEIQKYADKTITTEEDIRECFPEIVGLESTCQAIALGKQESFILECVARAQEQDNTDIADNTVYFDLYIRRIEECLIAFLEDVTDLMMLKQSSMQRLNETEIVLNQLQRFEYCTNKILDSMRDVLFITTPEGKIERVNRSTTELFAQKQSKLLRQSIGNLIQDPSFSHQQIYNSLLSSQDSVSKSEVNFKTNAGRVIHIEFECFIAPTEVKDFFNCVYIGRDVTARKKAEAEIRKSLAREKELRLLKSGFISMASHEFRNPLSSILLCVENLSNNTHLNPPEQKFYLQSIQDAAVTMNSLLEDILILSKAESGKQQLRPQLIDLRNLCEQKIQELTAIYVDKKINFDYLINTDFVKLDQATLRNILNNLLSNALKYSTAGKTVDLKVSESKESAQIIFEVGDRGIGIPQKSQKHLFESFYRASNVDSVPGTGLGLAIVKKSVDLYNGSITINSKENQGTTIIVRLPLIR